MADKTKIYDIMEEIGCSDGFHIPVANEENQLFEKEIKELLKKKAELLVIDESLDNDLRVHKKEIVNSSIEEAQNQKLIVAMRQQYETEKHMLIAAQRENDNSSRENKAAAKTFCDLIEEQKKMNIELMKNSGEISIMRETVEWGEETLKSWNEDLAEENTNVNILEAYHLEDDNRFKELDLRRRLLQRDVIDRESIVEKELGELLRVERELEQTSKLTRQAQKERNRLIEQWENAANFFNSTQKDSQHIVDEINKIREAALKTYEDMNEYKQKHEDNLEANNDIRHEIDITQRSINRLKLSIHNKQAEIERLHSEVSTAKISLSAIDNDLENERTKRRHMINEQAKLKTQIQEKDHAIATLKNNMFKIKNESMTKEERLIELNKIYEDQKAIAEQLLSEKNKVQKLKLNVQAEIKQLESKMDLLKGELERCHNKQMLSRKEKTKSKQLLIERKEIFYNLSFQLEMINAKITEAKGTVNIEEMNDLEVKLQTLSKELNLARDDQLQLQKQIKSTETESRRLTKDIETKSIEVKIQKDRLEELNALIEGGEKQIQQLREQNQRLHMEEMIVNLKVEQMKKMTDNECEKVHSLAQQREELTWDINKRKVELAEIHERINKEKKQLADEKSSMKRKSDVLTQYIVQRKNKYSILAAATGTCDESNSEGEGAGDRNSFKMSEHRIRLTREKLELQETGYELQERVQKMETEIMAMENTLHVLNASNSCYETSLSAVNPASAEYKNMIVQEETFEKLNSMWSQKKKSLEKIENEIQDLEVQYKIKNDELESLIRLRDIKQSELERAQKETDEQMVKLNRANSRILLDIKQIDKNNCDPDKRNVLKLIKRDIILRMQKKAIKCVLEKLSEMSVQHVEVELTIKQYLSEMDLKLPAVSSLMLGKPKSSCNSSTVSCSSAVSSISSNISVISYLDEERMSSVSVVTLE